MAKLGCNQLGGKFSGDYFQRVLQRWFSYK